MSVPVIKSRMVRWAGHVARHAWRGIDTGFWFGNLKDRGYLEDNGRAGNSMGGRRMDWSGSEYGEVEGFCEHGNEPLYSTKCGELLYKVTKY